ESAAKQLRYVNPEVGCSLAPVRGLELEARLSHWPRVGESVHDGHNTRGCSGAREHRNDWLRGRNLYLLRQHVRKCPHALAAGGKCRRDGDQPGYRAALHRHLHLRLRSGWDGERYDAAAVLELDRRIVRQASVGREGQG